MRGAFNKLAQLSAEELARGVICASAGNHAQGVALAARTLVSMHSNAPVSIPCLKSDVYMYGANQLESQIPKGQAYPHFNGIWHKYWLLKCPWVDMTLPRISVHTPQSLKSLHVEAHRRPRLASSVHLQASCARTDAGRSYPGRHMYSHKAGRAVGERVRSAAHAYACKVRSSCQQGPPEVSLSARAVSAGLSGYHMHAANHHSHQD